MATTLKYPWGSSTEAIKNYISNPSALEALKKEYSRLRTIEAKRISRLQKSEFANLDSARQKVATPIKSFYTKTGKFNKSAFANEFAKMQRFLESERSLVTGQKSIRERTLGTLQERGYNITDENYTDFIRVMETLRSKGLDRVYDSARVINNFLEFKGNRKMTTRDFNKFFNNLGNALDDVD